MRFTDYTINIINYLGDRNKRLSPYVLILLNEQNVYYVVRITQRKMYNVVYATISMNLLLNYLEKNNYVEGTTNE